MHVDSLRAVKGGFYFHPCDEDLSPGTPESKSHFASCFRSTPIPEML